MFDPIEKLFKRADDIKLDSNKKDVIHQNVLQYMKQNPLSGGVGKKAWFGFSLSNIHFIKLKMPAVVLASIMLFVLVGGGVVSAKADTALPGDLLYPVKIGFNEKIQEALAFSDNAKLNLNIKLAELRLQEAEQLALQNKLNDNNQAKINSNFDEHANQALAQLNVLESKKDNQNVRAVTVDFEASLKAHGIVISGLQENTKNNATNTLVGDIENVVVKVSGSGSDGNNIDHQKAGAGNSKNAFDGKKQHDINSKILKVEQSLGVTKKLIEDNKTTLGSQAVLQSQDNLNLVQQKIDDSRAHIENNNNDYQASDSSLRQASVINQEAQNLIHEKTHLKVNIPINIAPDNSGNSDNHDKQKHQDEQK